MIPSALRYAETSNQQLSINQQLAVGNFIQPVRRNPAVRQTSARFISSLPRRVAGWRRND